MVGPEQESYVAGWGRWGVSLCWQLEPSFLPGEGRDGMAGVAPKHRPHVGPTSVLSRGWASQPGM